MRFKMLTLKTDVSGWEGGTRGRIYGYIEMIHFCCTAEADTTLQSNYTPAKKQKEFRSRWEFPLSLARGGDHMEVGPRDLEGENEKFSTTLYVTLCPPPALLTENGHIYYYTSDKRPPCSLQTHLKVDKRVKSLSIKTNSEGSMVISRT